MTFYRGNYRNYGYSYKPTKYSQLKRLFGEGVLEIKQAFINLNGSERNELFAVYGGIYGKSAESYARKTFPSWKSGVTTLSGQTMERLVELVPPFLSASERYSILERVLSHNRKDGKCKSIRVDISDPDPGFQELRSEILALTHEDRLSHIPEHVMEAASWLYEDDITSARAVLADADKAATEIAKSSALKEIVLLERTIKSGQVKTANYSVEMPAGTINVTAYTPSKCFVSTVCYGKNSPQTRALRAWRDECLMKHRSGRKFVIWYYENGEAIARTVARNTLLKFATKIAVGAIAGLVQLTGRTK